MIELKQLFFLSLRNFLMASILSVLVLILAILTPSLPLWIPASMEVFASDPKKVETIAFAVILFLLLSAQVLAIRETVKER